MEAVSMNIYLVLSNEAVRLQRLSPAQADLLLVTAAKDRIHRNGSRNWDGNIPL